MEFGSFSTNFRNEKLYLFVFTLVGLILQFIITHHENFKKNHSKTFFVLLYFENLYFLYCIFQNLFSFLISLIKLLRYILPLYTENQKPHSLIIERYRVMSNSNENFKENDNVSQRGSDMFNNIIQIKNQGLCG